MKNKLFTRSGIPLKTFYDPQDVEASEYRIRTGDPGSYPFTRGIRPDLYGKEGWIQRGLSGEGDPTRSNEQIKYLISKGQTGVDIIGDAPTMAMMDPDHPLASKSVGTQGVSLCCLDDFLELYKDVPFDQLSISGSLPPIVALTGLYHTAKEYGFSPKNLRGSMLQTPFYAEDCGYAMLMPFRLRLRLSIDCITFCTQHMPKFHSFLEDTYFFSETGLDAVEEMALGFIEIRYLIQKLLEQGADIDSFAPRIAILVNCGMDVFEEIAKIRASRRLFARMMKEEFGAKKPASQATVITSHTSGLSMTAQQPFNNIVRGAIQSLALVMAGVQAMEISAFDEAYRTPSAEAHLVGLRTQQVVHLESGVSKVTDPLGGSYYVENLTNEMEMKIWAKIQAIESQGDPGGLVENGWFKALFHDAMERRAKSIMEKELLQIGVNTHLIADEEDTLLKSTVQEKIEPDWKRIEKVKKNKGKRDMAAIRKLLKEVRSVAESNENLVEPSIAALAGGATVGELAGAMRLAYGEAYDPFGLIEPVI